jgi:hypothetical protein
MRKVFALLIPILLLSGCLSTGEKTGQEPTTPQIVEQVWENESYQFWNLAPAMVGNQTITSFNQTGDVIITVDLDAEFHTPLAWERGYVNYTLINENETVFSHQMSEGDGYFEINISNLSNLTIQIQSSGSDSPTDDRPGDWFIARTYCEMRV